GVHVGGDVGLRRQPHQPRAAPGAADALHHLHDVRALFKPRRGLHFPGERIALRIPADSHQGDRIVAGKALRVRAPGCVPQRQDLLAQGLDVEGNGQLDERYLQFHGPPMVPAGPAPPTRPQPSFDTPRLDTSPTSRATTMAMYMTPANISSIASARAAGDSGSTSLRPVPDRMLKLRYSSSIQPRGSSGWSAPVKLPGYCSWQAA